MPALAQEALYRRLRDSSLLALLQADVTTLAGVSLELHPLDDGPGKRPQGAILQVPVVVGKVSVGQLVLKGAVGGKQLAALERWLQMAVGALAEELMHVQTAASSNALPGAITMAARILRERYTEPLDLAAVASEVRLSRERLSRLFHESLGITFSDYLNLVRLQHCRELLLEGSQSIADIAFTCGFQSLSQFNRRFKTAEGISPREYMRRTSIGG